MKIARGRRRLPDGVSTRVPDEDVQPAQSRAGCQMKISARAAERRLSHDARREKQGDRVVAVQ